MIGCVGGQVDRAKSSWVSGWDSRPTGILDFGVWVGLGEHIETTPLSNPGVPYFRVQT